MKYAVPLFLLCIPPAIYFALGRRGFRSFGTPQVVLRVAVAAPLVVSGAILHVFRIRDAASIIPPGFPEPQLLVVVTGVFELAGAAGLFVPAWRRRAGFCLLLLMIAIFPANIYAAGQVVGGVRMPEVGVRFAMQVVYMLMILLASFGLPVPASVSRRDEH